MQVSKLKSSIKTGIVDTIRAKKFRRLRTAEPFSNLKKPSFTKFLLLLKFSELSFFLQRAVFTFRNAGRKHGTNPNTRAIISGTEVDFSAGYRRFRYLSVFIKGPHTTLSFTFHRAKLDANADWIPTNLRFDESAAPILQRERKRERAVTLECRLSREEYGFYSILGKFLGSRKIKVRIQDGESRNFIFLL